MLGASLFDLVGLEHVPKILPVIEQGVGLGRTGAVGLRLTFCDFIFVCSDVLALSVYDWNDERRFELYD